MTTPQNGVNYNELVKNDRVHGRVYTDPAIFDEEMDKIFSRGWVYVGSGIWRPDKAAAVTFLRKVLKEQGYTPGVIVTDTLRSYGAAKSEMGLSARHERGLRRNNRAENSHQPTRGASARCSGSRACGQPRDFFPSTPPSTTRSMFNVTSCPAARSAASARKRHSNGGWRQWLLRKDRRPREPLRA